MNNNNKFFFKKKINKEIFHLLIFKDTLHNHNYGLYITGAALSFPTISDFESI